MNNFLLFILLLLLAFAVAAFRNDPNPRLVPTDTFPHGVHFPSHCSHEK